MTALILRATSLLEEVVPKTHALYLRFTRALDALADARIRNAVPEWQLRKARRDVDRYRRLMHHEFEDTLDLSKSRAYDCALDILGVYKLTGNFHVNLEIVLEDLGAFDKVTFEIVPNSHLPYHPDCRRVVFRPNENVHMDRFRAIMRSISDRIGFDAAPPWWV